MSKKAKSFEEFYSKNKDDILDIPAELHIYPVGGHGLGLATAETACPNGYGIQPECESWIQLAGDWMKHMFENK